MASSQVNIASIRTSFGCVLRDRNQRCSDDVKAQVKTAPPESAAISDENSQNRVDSWVGNKPKKNNKSRLRSPENPRTSKGNHISVRAKRNENLGGASSLVQIWEARMNQSNGGNSPIHCQSIESVQEIHLPAPFIDGESESENESKKTVEIESGTLNLVFDSGEGKCGRVADIIQRLSNKQELTSSDNGGAVDMPEKSSFSVVTCSPPRLTHLERDRHRELESLLERKTVSRFTQRGCLKSMLRLRSLKRGLVIQDRHLSTTKADSNHFEAGSRVFHLREKFRENTANFTAEAEGRNDQQSTVETERSTKTSQLKEVSILRETTSIYSLSPQNRKIEEAILRNKETESKMSYLQLQETRVAENFKSRSDNTIVSTSITHQEPQIPPENKEANKVESVTEVNRETLHPNEWEEQEEYEDEQSYYGEMSYDWVTEISRPRTYWEDLRKSRYQEVMNTRSEKDDICRLLERKRVSGFLQSDLREKIDKIIMSRGQTHLAQLIEEEERSDKGEEEDEDRDDLSHTSSQVFAPSPAGSWSSQDIGVTSTPDLIPLHNNLHSTEMENISDLRSQILQLQLEMSELRDSVKTCLDVNANLQKSVHRENPLKRKCCVCNETQVETLLYRCGHICTCLRCANELQCNGGKCPICHAKILDVVRVFVDSTT